MAVTNSGAEEPGPDRDAAEAGGQTLSIAHAQAQPSAAAKPGSGPLAAFFENGNPCFTDQDGVPYWAAPVAEPEPHVEIFPVDSDATRRLLILEELAKSGLPLSRREVRDRVWFLSAKSMQGPRRVLHNRFAADNGTLWLDMGDPLRRAIHVTPDDWSVVQPPPLFRRFAHQEPLVEPARGGQLADLLNHLPPLSESDGLLLLAWAVTACVPSVACPMLILIGQHGAAKSTAQRRLRQLLDPSRVLLLGEDGRRDLLLTFAQHAIPAFDNLGSMSQPESDLCCRVVTGSGTFRRKLYTDTGGVVLEFRRPILLNGLQLPSTRPDFLDRAVVLRVKRLERHRPEAELNAEFAAAAPRLLGVILDTLSSCLRLVPEMPVPGGFRMADFARWGRAVAVTLGLDATDFDAAYREALLRQSGDVVEADRVALAVIEYARRNPQNLGLTLQARDFFAALEVVAREFKLDAAGWPGRDSALSGRLRELVPTLLALGYRLTKLKRTSEYRSQWRLEKVTPDDIGVTAPPELRQAEADVE
jgi:hypothetical protein